MKQNKGIVNPFNNIHTLATKALKLNLIKDVECTGYVKLGATDKSIMYKQLAAKFLQLSFGEMWRGDVLPILKLGYPSLYTFLWNCQLSSKNNNIKGRKEPASDVEVVKLIRYALVDKLIDEVEEDTYLAVMKHSKLQSTLDNVEYDILIRVDDFDYDKFKAKALSTLRYIEMHYPVWYDKLISPKIDRLK